MRPVFSEYAYYLMALMLSEAPALNTSVNEFLCMVEAVHYEAGGEPERGKQFVANVIVNRRDRIRSQPDICSVVYAEGQFTYNKGETIELKNALDVSSFNETLRISYLAVQGWLPDASNGADHYFNPKTIKRKKPWMVAGIDIGRVGNHHFRRLIDDNGNWMN